MFLAAGLATVITRALPALVFAGRDVPPVVSYLAKVLPPATMAMLVVFCLRKVSVITQPFGLPELLALAATGALWFWRKNVILSVLVGTALYMVLLRVM
jgi:branched-subunit amino acid transport protein AzlD